MAEGFERVHYLVEEAFFEDADRPVFSERFLYGVEAVTSFHAKPLFAALHEPIYCQGTASNWAAHRVRDEFPQFDPASARVRVHGRDDLPVDVRAAVLPAAAAGGGGAGGGAVGLAGAV